MNPNLDDQHTDVILSQSLIISQPSIDIFENILKIGKKSIDILGKSI